MKSQIEIERKWVLFETPQANSELKIVHETCIEQYYTEGGYRHRYSYNSEAHKDKYLFERIKKIKLGEGISNETEIQRITWDEYENGKKNNPIVKKFRRTYEAEGLDLKFEVDDYSPIRLMVLEVELPSIDYAFQMPYNIQQQIFMEVTGNEMYSNKYLAGQLTKRTWKP